MVLIKLRPCITLIYADFNDYFYHFFVDKFSYFFLIFI